MRLTLCAIGRMKRGPEAELADRYIERSRSICRQAALTGFEIREFPESRAQSARLRQDEESGLIAGQLDSGHRLIVFDERGQSMSSEGFASIVAQMRDDGVSGLVLALGGPDGHGEDLRKRADHVVGFGAMTWPHQLARIMAAEQIYRALTILSGHPYHRG